MIYRDSKKQCYPPETDFLVPIDRDEFRDLRISHLYSGVYNDPPDYVNRNVGETLNGFSEWGTQEYPTVSIGWDWNYLANSHGFDLSVSGKPFFNVMITGRIFETESCDEIVRAYINTLDWKPAVLTAIKKYFN